MVKCSKSFPSSITSYTSSKKFEKIFDQQNNLKESTSQIADNARQLHKAWMIVSK